MIVRRYSELIKIPTFEERYEYLRIGGKVGESTFGFERYLNQFFYSKSEEWKKARRETIIRDNGCDLGISDYPMDRVIVHHMNPITRDDILNRNPDIFNPEFLICVSLNTHNAIHFGDKTLLPEIPKERRPGDTCPWRLS